MSHSSTSAASTAEPGARATARDLVSLVKPTIMINSLLTAAGGMSLAPGGLSGVLMLVLLLGTALIVGAANTLNMYLERDIDCMMPRTKTRPLPAQRAGRCSSSDWRGSPTRLYSPPGRTNCGGSARRHVSSRRCASKNVRTW